MNNGKGKNKSKKKSLVRIYRLILQQIISFFYYTFVGPTTTTSTITYYLLYRRFVIFYVLLIVCFLAVNFFISVTLWDVLLGWPGRAGPGRSCFAYNRLTYDLQFQVACFHYKGFIVQELYNNIGKTLIFIPSCIFYGLIFANFGFIRLLFSRRMISRVLYESASYVYIRYVKTISLPRF